MREIFVTITEPDHYGLSRDDQVFRGTTEDFAKTFNISLRIASQEQGETTDGWRTMSWGPALSSC